MPLGDVADTELATGLNRVSRENGKRRVVVQANVRGRDIGSFVEEAKRRIAEVAPPPPGTYLDRGGQFENLQRAKERLLVVVPVCFFPIFLLLFTTFNSVKYALMVITCVPLALTGGIIALWPRDRPFSISAAVGSIALSDVAVLNGLVMVTFINPLREAGEPPKTPSSTAASSACALSSRPPLWPPWASSRWRSPPAAVPRCRSRGPPSSSAASSARRC